MKIVTIKLYSTLPLILVLFNLLYEVFGVTPSDDITNIWYFGCRWFGGSVGMVACNCSPEAEEMYVQKNSIPGYDTTILEINDCAKVRFGSNSVSNLPNLRSVLLNNIRSLSFEENSLNWYGYRDTNINQEERFDLSIPSLKVIIRDTTVKRIAPQTFGGRINEIAFKNVIAENIEAFAFSNLLQMEKLLFENVVLKEVKPQAFKKFGTEFLAFHKVRAEYLPSRTFSNITVHRSFMINDSEFTILRPGAFLIHNPTSFQVTNTRVDQLDGEAFKVVSRGDVLFRNNTFNTVSEGAFTGISINREEVTSARVITFDSNTFSHLTKESLQVQPDFETKFLNFNLNQTCDCNIIDHNFKQSEFYTEIRCLNNDGQYMTVREYKSQNCWVISGYNTMIITVCVLIAIVGVAAIVFYLYYRLVYKSQKYGCEKGGKPPLSLIVPDGRTYKETELHVIVERTDLLTTDL